LNKFLTSNHLAARIGLFVAVFVVIFAATFAIYSFALNRATNDLAQQPANGAAAIVDREETFTSGTPVEPPLTLSDFTLTGNDSQPISLSDLRGSYVLMTFGYTHCPDYCPTTMAEFAQVKQILGDQADNVEFALISVDGERDTPTRMGEYLAAFDANFIGMTGEEESVRDIGQEYGLGFEAQRTSNGQTEYAVDHTVQRYLIDPDGNLIMTYSFSAQPETITADLQTLLNAAN